MQNLACMSQVINIKNIQNLSCMSQVLSIKHDLKINVINVSPVLSIKHKHDLKINV